MTAKTSRFQIEDLPEGGVKVTTGSHEDHILAAEAAVKAGDALYKEGFTMDAEADLEGLKIKGGTVTLKGRT